MILAPSVIINTEQCACVCCFSQVCVCVVFTGDGDGLNVFCTGDTIGAELLAAKVSVTPQWPQKSQSSCM